MVRIGPAEVDLGRIPPTPGAALESRSMEDSHALGNTEASRQERQDPVSYDASAITVLEGLDAVRKRPGMYIGGTDSKGLHHLVSEVLDNSMDEAVAGFATKIDIEFTSEEEISISDNQQRMIELKNWLNSF